MLKKSGEKMRKPNVWSKLARTTGGQSGDRRKKSGS